MLLVLRQTKALYMSLTQRFVKALSDVASTGIDEAGAAHHAEYDGQEEVTRVPDERSPLARVRTHQSEVHQRVFFGVLVKSSLHRRRRNTLLLLFVLPVLFEELVVNFLKKLSLKVLQVFFLNRPSLSFVSHQRTLGKEVLKVDQFLF